MQHEDLFKFTGNVCMKTQTPQTRKYELVAWLIYTHILSKIPYSLGNKYRTWYARKNLKGFGEHSNISTNVRLLSPNKIVVGSNVGIARDVTLDGRGGIEVGDFTLIGFESG
jgi:acetyltransferase-like isoleucine patch superfamily enzyme